MNVLFVCSGNTCRSPMAEVMLEDAVEASDLLDKEVRVKSCGTFAAEDVEATIKAQTVMEELGHSLSRHKSKQFDQELAEWADLILTMQPGHIEELEAMAPQIEDKTHTLLGYINGVEGFPGQEGFDVEDPYGGDLDDYRECAAQLERAIAKLMQKLEAVVKYEQ